MTQFSSLLFSTGNYMVEVIRIVYLLSLVISLFVYYKREHAPGGIITAGAIVLMIHEPARILLLIITSLLIIPLEVFIEKKISKRQILLAKDKVLIRVMLSILLSALFYVLFTSTFKLGQLDIVGTVAPALIASTLANPHHRKKSVVSILLASGIATVLFFMLKYVYIYILPKEYINQINLFYAKDFSLDFWSVLIMYLLFLSITIYNFYLRRTKKIQPLGLMVGAYLGLFILQPQHLLFILVIIVVTTGIVKLVDSVSLLFGYRTFVLASLVAGLLYVTLEKVCVMYFNFYPMEGMILAGIAISSVLSSEFSQHLSKKRIVALFILILFSGIVFLSTYGIVKITDKDGQIPNIYTLLEKEPNLLQR